MDRLAVELLAEIFIMACMDGGQATARSLSLVCKQYNAVALPLHTVFTWQSALGATPPVSRHSWPLSSRNARFTTPYTPPKYDTFVCLTNYDHNLK